MIIGILLLALGGGAVALHSVYTVRTVYVEGNVHYTEDEIMEIVMSGPLGDNSLYLSLKYRDRGIQDIPFVDVMNVSILAPDTIKITVYEKALAGYVKYLDALSRGLAPSGPLSFCKSSPRFFLRPAENSVFSKLFVDATRFLWQPIPTIYGNSTF